MMDIIKAVIYSSLAPSIIIMTLLIFYIFWLCIVPSEFIKELATGTKK